MQAQINSSSKRPIGPECSLKPLFPGPLGLPHHVYLRGFQTFSTRHHDGHPAQSRLTHRLQGFTVKQQQKKKLELHSTINLRPTSTETNTSYPRAGRPGRPRTVCLSALIPLKPGLCFLFWGVTLGLSTEESERGKIIGLRGQHTWVGGDTHARGGGGGAALFMVLEFCASRFLFVFVFSVFQKGKRGLESATLADSYISHLK